MRPCLFLLLLALPAAQAAPCTAESGTTRARLLELYTSEGCSSCPPADRWLSHLPPAPDTVPLAFHVDYWDRLGWRDPYGQAAFSQRQRARNRASGWIYTPQVMLDGTDFRTWPRGLPPSDATPAPVRLRLLLAQTPAQLAVTAEVRPVPAGAALYLALYENRLQSAVTAGENADRMLRHDYVVRALAGPFDASTVRHRFALQTDWKAADLGVAAFVLDRDGNTLQALARPACP